jgi:8-oxo-dGTP diphosphatase
MIDEIYGGRIRVRVCGILQHEGKILLLNHQSINPDQDFWNCPGGGMEAGETLENALLREFLEETHLSVSIGQLLHHQEIIQGKLHAVELYFSVSACNFAASLGQDPEYNILTELRWFSADEIHQLPKAQCPEFLRHLCFK